MPSGLVGAWLRRRSLARRVAAWALAVGGPALLTLASLPLRSSLVLGGFLFSLILVVIAVAVLDGVLPALTAVVLGVLVRVVFFAPPFVSSHAGLQPNLVSLSGFAIVGAVVAILIGELAKLAEEQASSRRVEAALRRVATLVAAGAPTDELFAAVCEEAGKLLHAEQTTMSRYESDDAVTFVAGWSRSGAAFTLGARLRLGGRNLATMVARSHRPARMDSYSDASGEVAEVFSEFGFRSAAGTPIVVQGRLWGVLIATTVNEQPLAPDTETRLASFTELAATAIANAQAQADVAASRARILAAADETRRRIERDLHDGVQQRLITQALLLSGIRDRVPADVSADVDQVRDELAATRQELRDLCQGVHPTILVEAGLQAAIRDLARRSPLPVRVQIRAGGRLPGSCEINAYYVAAEAFTNAAKHADASAVDITIEEAGGTLTVQVRDDGAGGADASRGSGLTGLRDRVEAVGGSMRLDSPAGVGTVLTVLLPVTADDH